MSSNEKKSGFPIILIGVIVGLAIVLFLWIIVLSASNSSGKKTEKKMRAAEKYAIQHEYEKAEKAYGKIMKDRPDYAGANLALSNLYAEWAQEAKAENDIQNYNARMEYAISVLEQSSSDSLRYRAEILKNEMNSSSSAQTENAGDNNYDAEEASDETIETSEQTQQEQEGPLATITFTWDLSNITIYDQSEETDFDHLSDLEIHHGDSVIVPEGETVTTTDENGEILMDESITQEGNVKKYVCNIYSWDVGEFNLEAQTIAPTLFRPNYQVYLTVEQENGKDFNLDAEYMVTRASTGAWFVTICSVKNGYIDMWEATDEEKKNSYQIDPSIREY